MAMFHSYVRNYQRVAPCLETSTSFPGDAADAHLFRRSAEVQWKGDVLHPICGGLPVVKGMLPGLGTCF